MIDPFAISFSPKFGAGAQVVVTYVVVDHVGTQYLDTAFPVTGSFRLTSSGQTLIYRDDAGNPYAVDAAFGAPETVRFRFMHTGYKERGGRILVVSVLGVPGKSNLFAVI